MREAARERGQRWRGTQHAPSRARRERATQRATPARASGPRSEAAAATWAPGRAVRPSRCLRPSSGARPGAELLPPAHSPRPARSPLPRPASCPAPSLGGRSAALPAHSEPGGDQEAEAGWPWVREQESSRAPGPKFGRGSGRQSGRPRRPPAPFRILVPSPLAPGTAAVTRPTPRRGRRDGNLRWELCALQPRRTLRRCGQDPAPPRCGLGALHVVVAPHSPAGASKPAGREAGATEGQRAATGGGVERASPRLRCGSSSGCNPGVPRMQSAGRSSPA